MKKFLIQRYTLLLFFVFLGYIIFAQDHIQFRNYTISDGLSQSSVSCVLQDQLGALWLGTQDGINRFNGKNFEVFSSDEGYSISNEYVNTSYIDEDGNIWFGTYDGLTQYNPSSVKFTAYKLPSKKHFDISAIQADGQGNLWLGTAYGNIYKFDLSSHKTVLVDKSTFESKIIAINLINKKLVFISKYDGVLFTDQSFKNKEIIHPHPSASKNLAINNTIVSPFHQLVITTNEGVFYYDSNINQFVPTHSLLSKLSDINIINAIFLNQNKVIVATENAGLYQVYRNENDSLSIINYRANIFQKGSLLSNRINGLFMDKQGVIWIFTDRGLSSFNPNFIGFKGVGVSENPKEGLFSQNVWGFAESNDAHLLFIATDKGVVQYNRTKHVFNHFNRNTQDNKDHTVLCLKILSKNKLLVGCIDGLYELSIDSMDVSKYSYNKIQQGLEDKRGFDIVYSIIPYKDKATFMIGSRGGVSVFNYNTKKFIYLQNNPDNPNSIGRGACRFVFNYKNGYYASPASGGIYQIYSRNGELEANKQNIFSPISQASQNYFSDFLQTNQNTLWFATMGSGLIKYNLSTKKITIFDKSKGLPNNVIYGVKAAHKNPNYIWLSTNKGVVAYEIKTKKFYNFTTKDGLMSNEMNLGASFVSKSGEIYFGGIQGYNFINPREPFYANTNLTVYFSGISVENKAIFPEKDGILSKSIAFTKKIKLSYYQRSLKLRFFANDLTNPDRIEYKYVMQGGDDAEENLGSNNQLRLASIAPGTYQLFIYARVKNGEWTNKPAHLTIVVARPFWLTWWFYAVLVVLLALVVLYRVRRRIDESHRRQIRLEMKISERTRELRKKNEQIEKQKSELELEKEKSERLLDNVLPKDTASQLKKEGQSTARDFEKVTIMFTDFVGFSQIAESMAAKDLVSILDKHFRAFDKIIDRNNLEKIKTIGDAYMCVGGVPIRDKTNPINTTLAAVQIKYYMLEHKEQQVEKGEPYWKLRIGINTGSVSAGVIGTKRYAYDVWGSAVNRAQRMERFCEPEKIAITQATFDYIEPYFECLKVGKVETKSGLKITMYEVVCIKPELSVDGMGILPNNSFKKLVELHHYSKINYYKAERFIMSKLEKELDPKLHYHSFHHSKDVTRQVERIAIEEGITDEDLFLLKSAASYHDAGFIEKYDKNEPIGARMAAEILPQFGYTPEHIQRIEALIYATEVPHKPKNILEKIICDADLDYLGRDDFHEISDSLRQELREFGKLDSDRKWDEIQVKFFEQHQYFTDTAIRTRLNKKNVHLAQIKERLTQNNYKD